MPDHVAIIMDGNGRWAKAQGWRRIKGHEEGTKSVRSAVRTCRRLGIKALTLYAFSTENWSRPKTEVTALMTLLKRFLKSEQEELLEKGIRLNAIGDLEKLPRDTFETLRRTMEATSHCNDMVLTLALSYGGRQEIVRAAAKLCKKAEAGLISWRDIDENAISENLYTKGLPDPDLLIRTSGELRTSNFLPWQLVYSEFYFTDAYWPDFREPELLAALEEYAMRQRRFGKTSEQTEKNP